MMKKLFDLTASLLGLIILSPIILIFLFLVWRQDHHNPFYVAPRIGQNNQKFYMIKIRSMIMNADQTGVNSTSADDQRITKLGTIIRRYKLDEITQLINVLKGNMSLVGPRPQVEEDVDLYTDIEKELLSVRPGITDFASIVFSDEGEILKGKENPNKAYNELIRPGKSMLGLFYIKNRSLFLDIYIILCTIITIVNKEAALKLITAQLKKMNADQKLIEIAERKKPLVPSLPPGSKDTFSA